jgi:hypothetical protein
MGRLCSCNVTVRHCCTTSSTSTMGRACLYHTRPPCDSASGSVCAHTSVSAESIKKAPAHLIPSTFPHLTHFNYYALPTLQHHHTIAIAPQSWIPHALHRRSNTNCRESIPVSMALSGLHLHQPRSSHHSTPRLECLRQKNTPLVPISTNTITRRSETTTQARPALPLCRTKTQCWTCSQRPSLLSPRS